MNAKNSIAHYTIVESYTASRSKRILDLIVSGLGLTLVSPLLLLIALRIKLDSAGPVLYRGKRLGQNGKIFYILKFRTMRAEVSGQGAGITIRNDPRITRVGKFLRRYKLDELPQLWNVLRGEMSLVGPRPEDPRYLMYYTAAQRMLLALRPGITGAAALKFRDEQELLAGTEWEQFYVQALLPEKLNLELEYMQRANFWSDLELIAQTVIAVGSKGTQGYGTRPHH